MEWLRTTVLPLVDALFGSDAQPVVEQVRDLERLAREHLRRDSRPEVLIDIARLDSKVTALLHDLCSRLA